VSARAALAGLVACAALSLAACGGGDEATSSTTEASTTTSTTSTAIGATSTSTTTSTTGEEGDPIEDLVATAAGVLPDEVECGEEDIEGLIGSGGTCTAAGTEYVVADRGEELELDTLTARLEDLDETRKIRGDYLKPKPPKNDVFAVAKLAVTNTGNGIQLFDDFGEQVQLITPSRTYREPFNILNGVATDSFLWKATKIKPNRTERGDVVFDIPSEAVDEMDTSGAIQVLNFGEEGNIQRADQIGLLRTGESAT
jgi:hypothetical protein